MKPRKRHLTAQIKPATKHALMAQLALAADEIERLRGISEYIRMLNNNLLIDLWQAQGRWWHRLMWWR